MQSKRVAIRQQVIHCGKATLMLQFCVLDGWQRRRRRCGECGREAVVMSYRWVLNDKGRCAGHGLAVVGGGFIYPSGLVLRRISKFGVKSTLRKLHSCYSVVK
jgi:hypothetical protein